MAKNKLSAAAYRSAIKKPGKHADGEGLLLVVSTGATGNIRASWTLLYQRNGKRTEMGLGSANVDGAGKGLSLAQARKARDDAHDLLAAGKDPRAEREKAKSDAIRAEQLEAGVPTLGAVLRDVYERDRAGWKSLRHANDWKRTIDQHVGALGERKVDAIAPKDVAAALKKLWAEHPQTADRARGRIEMAMNSAIAAGWRTAANPATKALMRDLLGKASPSGEHHAALPYDEVADFIKKLRALQDGSIPALALEFLVLTASRASEACGARWTEIDVDKAVWVIPKERMKSGREHRVPLSSRAMAIVTQMQAIKRNGYVFPSDRGAQHASVTGIRAVLQRMGYLERTTLHGFRSTFRDWAGDNTTIAREVAEAALAHAVGDSAEQAYRRGSALEKRRELMELWARFLDGEDAKASGDNVVQFKAG